MIMPPRKPSRPASKGSSSHSAGKGGAPGGGRKNPSRGGVKTRRPRSKPRSAALPEPPTPEEVTARCAAMGRELSDGQAKRLAEYLTMLQKWNKVMNLVGPAAWPDMLTELIEDSWHLADFLEGLAEKGLIRRDGVALDLGAGAGIPGIPLRIFQKNDSEPGSREDSWERCTYRLVEIREKRTLFLGNVLAMVDLPGTKVAAGKAEAALDCAREEQGGAALVLSRAFMPWRECLDFVRGGISPDGCLVFMTLEPAPGEEEYAGSGWKLVTSHRYRAAGKDRYFWVFSPRAASM